MIQKPKGTNDVYDNFGRKILYIRNLVETIAKTYNYDYFRTPTFERTELFKRGVISEEVYLKTIKETKEVKK